MLLPFVLLAGLVILLILVGRYGAESRPDFVDPTVKHGPFITPFSLRSP